MTGLRPVVAQAISELDAEHYSDGMPRTRGGCVVCWPNERSWPCATRQVADDLRAALGEGECICDQEHCGGTGDFDPDEDGYCKPCNELDREDHCHRCACGCKEATDD